MKNTSKYITTILLSIYVIFSVVSFVSAQQTITGGTGPGGSTVTGSTPPSQETFTLRNPLKVKSIGGLVLSFLEIISYILILFGVLMIIFVGFKYILYASQGNQSELTKLHGQLLWTIVGIAIVIGAGVIVQIVVNTLSNTGVIAPEVIRGAKDALQSPQ
jgi:hypothetical protein